MVGISDWSYSMHKHIVAAVDDSPTARLAIEAAVELAQANSAKLTLVHAVDEGLYAHFNLAELQTTEEGKNAVEHALIQEGQSVLEAARDIAVSAGATPEIRLLTSRHESPSDQIAHMTEQIGADLLVVGSHGRRGVKRLLLGSVADRLLRKLDISVMVVRGQPAE